ncbi:hypothetical protein L7F22_007035 [Adiantum nelumboides]|nr:hypothetical protein [Adiantum nelumboides]
MALIMCPSLGLGTYVHYGTSPLSLFNADVVITAQQQLKPKLCNNVLLVHTCKAEEWLEEPPSVDNFVCMLQELEEQKEPLAYVEQFFLKACQYGLDLDKKIGNSFVELFASGGHMSFTQQVFNRLPYSDEYSWSCLIQGFYEGGYFE